MMNKTAYLIVQHINNKNVQLSVYCIVLSGYNKAYTYIKAETVFH